MPRPVLNKTDFVQRYQAGEFGNRAPTWQGLAEFTASGYTGLVHIRNRNRGAITWYDVPAKAAPATWAQAMAKYPPRQLYISAMAPTELTLIQGEVQQGYKGLDLYYSTVVAPMRPALAAAGQQVYGILAVYLLRHYLCPTSHDWLMCLLDGYINHVVEFSVYSTNWGTLPGYNTVFWEVRNY